MAQVSKNVNIISSRKIFIILVCHTDRLWKLFPTEILIIQPTSVETSEICDINIVVLSRERDYQSSLRIMCHRDDARRHKIDS